MGRSVIPSDGANAASDVTGASRNDWDTPPFAQKTMRHLLAPGRSASLRMAAAMLAMTWAAETRASADLVPPSADEQHATAVRNLNSVGTAGDGHVAWPPPRRGGYEQSVQVVQATTGDTGQVLGRERHWAEMLSEELTNARRDIELLQRLEQEHDRAERLEQGLAAARRAVEAQTALTAKAVEEAARARQAAPGGAAELQNSLQQARERAGQLEQDLAAARRDVEAQTALAVKSGEEAARSRQAGESGAAELQQERERTARLERNLAAARRDVDTQTALAVKAGEEASRSKQAGESGAAELQQERERSTRLERDLAAARSDVDTQTALAAKAGEEASRSKQTGESGAAELQQERERSARLARDLAAARGDVETQAALAAKAGEEVVRRKQAAEAGATELRQSRARADALAQDLSLTRSAIYAYEAQARKAGDEAAELRQAAASSAPSLGKAPPDEPERFARLEQDLAVARRDVETQAALAAKAGEEASRLKAAGENGAVELQKSLQQERERSLRLEQDLAAVRRDVETQTALAAKAGEETSRLKAAGESGAAEWQKSLQQERERSARLERDLAVVRREVETQTALVAKAGEETSRLKAAGESGAAKLQKSLQQESERSARLERDLAAVRREVETQIALTAKAGEETSRLKAAGESSAAELQMSLQQERERFGRLELDLAAARRDAETHAALAAKAGEEALRSKQAAEASAAELRRSMRKEPERTDLPVGLSMTRSAINAYKAQVRKAGDEVAELREVAANSAPLDRKSGRDEREWSARLEQYLVPVRAERAPAAPARGDVQPNSEQAAVATGLVARASALLRQGDIGAARLVLERAVEIGSAEASFALAETYDPLILAKWKTQGTRGDASKAQGLYAKADAAGIQEAKARLEALRR